MSATLRTRELTSSAHGAVVGRVASSPARRAPHVTPAEATHHAVVVLAGLIASATSVIVAAIAAYAAIRSAQISASTDRKVDEVKVTLNGRIERLLDLEARVLALHAGPGSMALLEEIDVLRASMGMGAEDRPMTGTHE